MEAADAGNQQASWAANTASRVANTVAWVANTASWHHGPVTPCPQCGLGP